jgi:hypothetical protein
VLAASAASDGAMDGDAISCAACLHRCPAPDALQHNNRAVSPVLVSLLFDINPPFQSSSVLELDIMGLTRCLMKIHEEVTVA